MSESTIPFSSDQPVIEAFLDTLWVEHGLSENTLSAYRNDLLGLSRWLSNLPIKITEARRDHLLDYLSYRVQQGSMPRTSARLLSSIRRFYRYLVRQGAVQKDPSAQIEFPKLGRPLPETLTEEEIEHLLTAPNVDKAHGVRDRAMLEVLYACGLRVSELVGLTLNQVNLNHGVIRVMGKGNKERLIPFGEQASEWISKFVNEARADLLKSNQPCDALFITNRGTAMTRQAFGLGQQRDCCWWCKRPSRLSERIELERRFNTGSIEQFTAEDVELLVGDLWGPRAEMVVALGAQYIKLLEERR